MSEVIERPLWNTLRPTGNQVDTRTTVTTGNVDIEEIDGPNFVSASIRDDGIDVRVGELQLFVKHRHVTLVQSHPPYPIKEWTVLWEGDFT